MKVFENIGVDTKSKFFKRYFKHGYLDNIDLDYLSEIEEFYLNHYGKTIDPVTHLAIAEMTGVKDVKIIPQQIFRSVLLPFFNDEGMINANKDKNTYDILFSSFKQAHTVLKRIRGHYLTNITEHINRFEIEKLLLSDSSEYIIKTSDTNNGVNINKLKVINNKLLLNDKIVTLEDIENKYGYNFLIQRVLKQNKIMSEPHPSSVNTLRMVTLRWNNEIHNVFTLARFGVDNDVKDNLGAGGLALGIKEDGSFMPYGLSSSKKVYYHPTTNFPIKSLDRVPNFENFLNFTRELHKNIIHHDYVSWDIAVGEDLEPILIEANFSGECFAPQAGLECSLFGDKTSLILKDIRNNRQSKKKRNLKIKSISKLKKDIKKVKIENKKNERKLKNKEIELSKLKNSKSWKYTRTFRKQK